MGKEEREARRDERGMKKAMDLLRAQNTVPKKLEELGHQQAANRARTEGGRWDSPEVRDANGRGGR